MSRMGAQVKRIAMSGFSRGSSALISTFEARRSLTRSGYSGGELGGEFLTLVVLAAAAELAGQLLAADGDLGHLLLLDHLEELRKGQLLLLAFGFWNVCQSRITTTKMAIQRNRVLTVEFNACYLTQAEGTESPFTVSTT